MIGGGQAHPGMDDQTSAMRELETKALDIPMRLESGVQR